MRALSLVFNENQTESKLSLVNPYEVFRVVFAYAYMSKEKKSDFSIVCNAPNAVMSNRRRVFSEMIVLLGLPVCACV